MKFLEESQHVLSISFFILKMVASKDLVALKFQDIVCIRIFESNTYYILPFQISYALKNTSSTAAVTANFTCSNVRPP